MKIKLKIFQAEEDVVVSENSFDFFDWFVLCFWYKECHEEWKYHQEETEYKETVAPDACLLI